MTDTKITYNSYWFSPPNHPGYDLVIGERVTQTSGCLNDGQNSYCVLSNGFTPYFQGLNHCGVYFEYIESDYDCINGTCELSTKYKTPGFYKSLADCQKICGSSGVCGDGKQCVDPNVFCPQGKVCLDNSEYQQITNLISRISQQVCG